MTPARAIGIDLGGTAIKYGLTDATGRIWREDEVPTPATRDGIVAQLADCIARARTWADGRVVGVGLGVPGLVDAASGYVWGGAPQLPDWEDVALGEALRGDLPLHIDNDANMMGWGEYAHGSGQGLQHVLFLTIGTGIGGAIFLHGDLYRGHAQAAGELGCLPFSVGDREGYWEDFASTAALLRRYCDSGGDDIDARTLVARAYAGEALATQLLHEHTTLLGRGIGGLINIFNPERVVIGGGISGAGAPYIDAIDAAARRYALDACQRGVVIAAASLGNRAGFVGAAHVAHRLSGG
ncbi:MAG: ROK family protein [Bacteroidia bacterium]